MSSDVLHPDLPRFVSFGEVRVDLRRVGADQWRSTCAGAPWQVAMALSSLGELSAFAGAISRDAFGREIWQACAEAHLDLRFLQQLPKPPLLHFIEEPQSARPQGLGAEDSILIGSEAADLFFRPEGLPAGWVKALRWAHFGGLGLVREPLAGRLSALAEGLKAEGKKISYAPGYWSLMDSRYDDMLERMCRLADVIEVSEAELCALFRCADHHLGLAQISAWNPCAILLLNTQAGRTSIFAGAQEWSAEPLALNEGDQADLDVSDASMAGLLASLMRQPNALPDEHLRWAVAAAAAARSASPEYALPHAQPWTLPHALVATLAATVKPKIGA
ncbi:PfkB family carbohydrate kinase [Paucibacter sp. AS339]|uniref:PfkB family carbohydrate kinase n=1 Tax=Paucibacter hankyongi TaxID=3133434 RepID=UPI0030A9BB7A